MTVTMAALPPHDRPRERLLARGAEALADREFIALVLRNGAPHTSALDLAGDSPTTAAWSGSLRRGRRSWPLSVASGSRRPLRSRRRSTSRPSRGGRCRSGDATDSRGRRSGSGARVAGGSALACHCAGCRRGESTSANGGRLRGSDRPIVGAGPRDLTLCCDTTGERSPSLTTIPSGDATPSDADRRATADAAAAARAQVFASLVTWL